MKYLLKMFLNFLYPDKFILLRAKSIDSIALTFDDGPHPQNTKRLLEILEKEGIKATFFICGAEAEKYPELLKAISNEGHEIGNHSFSHKQLKEIGLDKYRIEVEKTSQLIRRHSQTGDSLFRPPYGELNLEMLKFISNSYLRYVGWTVDSHDSFLKNRGELASAFKQKTIKGGDIILFHEDYGSTIDALPEIIADLKKQEFNFVTVTELLERKS